MIIKRSILALGLCLSAGSFAQQRNPFAPPIAKMHYALDRTCDLINVDIDIDVDYPNRTYTGTTINTLSPLRNGLTEIMLMAGTSVNLTSVKVDGKVAKYRRDGQNLFITTEPLTIGKQFKVEIAYNAKNTKAQPFGGRGGFHWIEPTKNNPDPNRIGFWTQGETETNCEWAPTWDYPNDLATSNTKCTVQADWDMIGNGVLVSTKLSADKKKKTYNWKMTQPHATYLLTLVGGPLDIKRDKWQGIDLWYVVPRGSAYLIDNSFGNTKDMLTFFSKKLGVKYPWPKYAQNAMYDFGGGMENVSATTLGEGSLSEARDGYFNMDGLNAHELAHQWFGDLVTCKDWSDAWINESFATYLENVYMEYSRGDVAFQWELEDNLNQYLGESRRYKRPISTKMYADGDAMFDSHTYPKGGLVLHSLRRMLGDEAFFGGLNHFLTQWKYTPVESAQLRRSMTERTGINVEPFWEQYFDKPGHMVLDYAWVYEGGKVKLNVKQTQDTKDGTPIYIAAAKVDLIGEDGKHRLVPIRLSKADETFEIDSATKPGAVVFDPEHELLREIPTLHWADEELPLILKYGMNAPDRNQALIKYLQNPTPEKVKLATEVVAADKVQHVTFRNLGGLLRQTGPEMRGFWMSRLDHPNFSAQASALDALGRMPADPATTAKVRSMINDKAGIATCVAGMTALSKWDRKGNEDIFKAALNIKDRRGRIKATAEKLLKGE